MTLTIRRMPPSVADHERFATNLMLHYTSNTISETIEVQFLEEVAAELRTFVKEDPEFRGLIQQKVKQVLEELNLLAIVTQAVTEAVKLGIEAAAKEAVTEPSEKAQ